MNIESLQLLRSYQVDLADDELLSCTDQNAPTRFTKHVQPYVRLHHSLVITDAPIVQSNSKLLATHSGRHSNAIARSQAA